MTIPRAENVGSLLRPPRLLNVWEDFKAGAATAGELRHEQDDAVLAAIELQEAANLDVISDGEMRRASWSFTRDVLEGFEARPGPRDYPASAALAHPERPFPTVVRRIRPMAGEAGGPQMDADFAFLRANSTLRGKYTLPAPSYHRRYWVDSHSRAAYINCEEYLIDVRDWIREQVQCLMAAGCDYIQLDAPNYGSLCDPDTRQFHEDRGHDLDADIAFDAWLDSSVFDGLDGVTSALHVCRGNFPGGLWHSSGGYAVIADQLFPAVAVNTLLLEYDSDRAGDFRPLAKVRDGTVCVLGLVTTKSPELEDETVLETRIHEATTFKSIDELALSTQCGFASVAGNNPTTVDDQRAKLDLVARLAHRVWAS